MVAFTLACGDSGAGTATDADTGGNSTRDSATTEVDTPSQPTTSGPPPETADGTQTGTESATGSTTVDLTATTAPSDTTHIPETTTGPGDTTTTGSSSDTGPGPGEDSSTSTSSSDTSTSSGEDSSTGTSTSDTTDTSDTSDTTDGTTGLEAFCDGEGAILLPGDEVTCTGDLAEKTFTFALCSCTGVTTVGTFNTDSFNSNDPNTPDINGGSVGVNGDYSANVQAGIGGALWIDGSMSTVLLHDVAQDLQCGGTVSALALSHVDGDAYVEGNIGGLLPLMTIDGDLHIPQGKAVNANVNGQIIKEPVNVDTPCDCSDPIDIPGIVQHFKNNNDNATLGIDPAEFETIDLVKTIELPCGRFFFTEIQSLVSLNIKITGRTVIAIEGDFNNLGLFDLEIAPDAELDLFVNGNLTFVDLATVGDTTRPAALRSYVHGDVSFANLFTLGGNLYMPNSEFNAAGLGSVFGALFVGGIQIVDLFWIHYDSAILELEGCEDPGGSCGDCHDCLNPTPSCNGGECGPCQSDADCCPPFHCFEGGCYPEPG